MEKAAGLIPFCVFSINETGEETMNRSLKFLLASISVAALAVGWVVLDSAPALAGQPRTYGTAMNTAITPIPSGTGGQASKERGVIQTELQDDYRPTAVFLTSFTGSKLQNEIDGVRTTSGGTAIKTTDSTYVIATKARSSWQPPFALDEYTFDYKQKPDGLYRLDRTVTAGGTVVSSTGLTLEAIAT